MYAFIFASPAAWVPGGGMWGDWRERVRTSSCRRRQESGLSVMMGACTRSFLPVLLRGFRV